MVVGARPISVREVTKNEKRNEVDGRICHWPGIPEQLPDPSIICCVSTYEASTTVGVLELHIAVLHR